MAGRFPVARIHLIAGGTVSIWPKEGPADRRRISSSYACRSLLAGRVKFRPGGAMHLVDAVVPLLLIIRVFPVAISCALYAPLVRPEIGRMSIILYVCHPVVTCAGSVGPHALKANI